MMLKSFHFLFPMGKAALLSRKYYQGAANIHYHGEDSTLALRLTGARATTPLDESHPSSRGLDLYVSLPLKMKPFSTL